MILIITLYYWKTNQRFRFRFPRKKVLSSVIKELTKKQPEEMHHIQDSNKNEQILSSLFPGRLPYGTDGMLIGNFKYNP